jgi:lipopolysaccharide export system protein LptC
MMHRANRLFPIVLVVLMALMTLWLDQISQVGAFGQDLNPDRPEYTSEHVVATRFDTQGRIEQRMEATRMWQYPQQHDMFFDNGVVNVYRNSALDYMLTAETGHYNTESKQAFFDRRVHMLKPATAQQQATTVDTTAMSMDTVKRFASSQMPVTIHYGNSVATGTGFNYDYNAGLFNLLSFARVVYVQ